MTTMRRYSRRTAAIAFAAVLLADIIWAGEGCGCDAQRARQVQIIPSRAPHLSTPAAKP